MGIVMRRAPSLALRMAQRRGNSVRAEVTLTTLYKRTMMKPTWNRHEQFFKFIRAWQAEKSVKSIKDISDLVSFINWLDQNHKVLDWKREKIARLRTAMGHWIRCHHPSEANWWEGPIITRVWKGMWYNHKEGSHPEDQQTIGGLVDADQISQINRHLKANPHILEGHLRSKVMDGIKLKHGLCARTCEFVEMQYGDFDQDTNVMRLRANKAYTADHPVGCPHDQFVPVLTAHTRDLLIKLDKEARVRPGKSKLLLTRAECPAALITRVIQTCSRELGWDQSLKWCSHSLRHGGVHYLDRFARAQRAQGKEMPEELVLQAMHMSAGVKKSTYGRTLQQRQATAAQRKATATRQKRNRDEL